MSEQHIKIPSIPPRIQYVANGVNKIFNYPFAIFNSYDIQVYIGDDLQESGYTVFGAGDSAGGYIEFAIAPANNALITLVRFLPIERVTDFQEGGTLRAKNLNDALDKQAAFSQQVNEALGRALTLPITSPLKNITFPSVAEPNKILVWNADGTGFENSKATFDDVLVEVEGYRNEALDSKNKAKDWAIKDGFVEDQERSAKANAYISQAWAISPFMTPVQNYISPGLNVIPNIEWSGVTNKPKIGGKDLLSGNNTLDYLSIASKQALNDVFENSKNAILEKDFNDIQDLTIWTNNPSNMLLVREGTVFRVLDDTAPDFKAVRSPETGLFIPQAIEPFTASKIMTNAGGIEQTQESFNEQVLLVEQQVLGESKAYTDTRFGELIPTSIYMQANGQMTPVEPVSAGTIQTYPISSTESLLFSQSYTLPTADLLKQNNVYGVRIPFRNLVTNRDNIIRCEYIVNGVMVFNFITVLPRFANQEMLKTITNILDYDLNYPVNTQIELKVYGRLSSGPSATAQVLFYDKDNLCSLTRNLVVGE